MAKKRAMMIGLDGADPMVIKRMIAAGRLPNIKKAIETGVARENLSMIGAIPSVTPPNWCSMATGSWPRTHGVTCFHNHTLGKDLGTNEVNWDSRRIQSELIWETFSRAGKKSIMLNYCEAWPPRFEDKNGVYIDGSGIVPFLRMNIDYQKVVLLKEGDFKLTITPHVIKKSTADCVIEGDQYEEMAKNSKKNAVTDEFDPLIDFPSSLMTKYDVGPKDDFADKITAPLKPQENWSFSLPENAKTATIIVNDGVTRRHIVISASNGKVYDTVSVYASKKDEKPLAVVKNGKWAFPVYDVYLKNDKKVKVAYGIRVLSIKEDGSEAEIFITHAQNLEDYKYIYPQKVAKRFLDEVGPMCNFAKFGRYQTDCADVLFESFQMIHQWHTNATKWLFKETPDWDLFYIHLHSIDEYNHWYLNSVLPGSHPRNEEFMELIYKIYEENDKYVGEVMKYLDENTCMFITSDHGAIPHTVGDLNPGLGSLSGISVDSMEELGYTVTYIDDDGERKIDWTKTRAVCQRSSYIYVNLKGRDPYGIVDPAEYDELVSQIISDLYNYRHPETGKRVVSFCMTRDEMEVVGLGGPHVGDILIQLMPTYCKEHAYCPTPVNHEGFSLNCLCIMTGGNFKKGEKINRVIRVVDVAPTIAYLTETAMPSNTEGGVIWQAIKGFNEQKF